MRGRQLCGGAVFTRAAGRTRGGEVPARWTARGQLPPKNGSMHSLDEPLAEWTCAVASFAASSPKFYSFRFRFCSAHKTQTMPVWLRGQPKRTPGAGEEAKIGVAAANIHRERCVAKILAHRQRMQSGQPVEKWEIEQKILMRNLPQN